MWGVWGEWSACTVDCGGGTRTRTQPCVDTDMSDSVTMCDGTTPTDTENCNDAVCRK